MVTIATYNEQAKAKHLRERLEEAGVQADIVGEGAIQRVAFMSKPQANVKVKVEEKEFEKAQKLMREWEAADPEIGSAMRCPQCGSAEIEFPQLTRKFLTPALASVLFALKIFPKEFYCQSCHHTWPLKEVPHKEQWWQ
jgi:Zn finger protein HypA/HybF involved in hydrogenase expression